MKTVYVLIVSIVIVVSMCGGILYFAKSTDTLNADEFFMQVWKPSLQYEQNDTWTLHDKVEIIYLYKIPDILLYNETGNFEIMNEYTAVKFETSREFLRLDGNQTSNFTVGKYATHLERTKYYENEVLLEMKRWGFIVNSRYLPPHIYNKWIATAFAHIQRVNESPPFQYSREIMNETTFKLIITGVPDYYPYPLRWNQVGCEFIKYTGTGIYENQTIGELPKMIKDGNLTQSNNPELLSLFNITVYDNEEMIYNFYYPDDTSGDEFIQKDQYLLISWNTAIDIQIELISYKFNDSINFLGIIDFET